MTAGHAPSRGVKFLGSYTHQLDEKGRVALPASFRRETADQQFVLIEAYKGSLALYPELEWMSVQERMLEFRGRNQGAREFVLSLMDAAQAVQVDGQGRIAIPANLREAAGLKDQVRLVGAIDKIELWEPSQWEAAMSRVSEEWESFRGQIFR